MQRKSHIGFLLVAAIAPLVILGGCDKLRARDKLNKGVEAYKAGQYDAAIEDFKDARELDPNLTNAQIYLATAADRTLAVRIAQHHPIFTDVLASDGSHHLVASRKDLP